MEDMDFDSGLAFSLNEKETVNFKNSDSLILLPDRRSFSFGDLTSTLPVTEVSRRGVMGWLGCRSPSGGHISDRIIPTFTPHSFWPPSTPLLLCRVSCIPLFHAASMLPHWSSQCSGIQKAKDTPNHTCPYTKSGWETRIST